MVEKWWIETHPAWYWAVFDKIKWLPDKHGADGPQDVVIFWTITVFIAAAIIITPIVMRKDPAAHAVGFSLLNALFAGAGGMLIGMALPAIYLAAGIIVAALLVIAPLVALSRLRMPQRKPRPTLEQRMAELDRLEAEADRMLKL